MGSRSQLYSLVAMVSVLLTMLFLGPLLAVFPRAALGAVVIYAATRLVDIAELRRIARFRRSELVLALATTAAVLVLGLLNGVGVAIGLSILDLLRRIAKPHDGVLGYIPGHGRNARRGRLPAGRQVPGLVVYRYDSPLFFANAEDFKARALAAVDEAEGPVEWFLLNAEANTEVDLTAVDALDELRRMLARTRHRLRDGAGQEGAARPAGQRRASSRRSGSSGSSRPCRPRSTPTWTGTSTGTGRRPPGWSARRGDLGPAVLKALSSEGQWSVSLARWNEVIGSSEHTISGRAVMNLHHTKRALALTAAAFVGAVGISFAAVSPASAASYTCDGKAATIVGTNGADNLRGTSGRDVIVGLGGNDEIDGLGGNDVICGNAGNDEIDGGRGNDWLHGGAGHDEIDGDSRPRHHLRLERRRRPRRQLAATTSSSATPGTTTSRAGAATTGCTARPGGLARGRNRSGLPERGQPAPTSSSRAARLEQAEDPGKPSTGRTTDAPTAE